MKKKLLSVIMMTVLFLGNALFASSQGIPFVSTEDDPIWFTIESASTTPLAASYTGPEDLRGYAVYPNLTDANRLYARIKTGADDELWAFVNVDGVLKLKNKGTGLFMVDSHSVNEAGEQVSVGALGANQYSLKSGSQSFFIIWNNLKGDRWGTASRDNNSAFYLVLDAKTFLGEMIATANGIVEGDPAIGEDPGFVSPDSPAIQSLMTAIESAEQTYASADESPDYEGATKALQDHILAFYASPLNEVVVSDDTNETWYYIVSSATNAYCAGKTISNMSDQAGVKLQFVARDYEFNQMWKVVDAGDGKFGIQNRATGFYVDAQTSVGTSETISAYNFVALGHGQYNIKTDDASPLHAQETGSVIVNWTGGLNSPSSWNLVTASAKRELARYIEMVYSILATDVSDDPGYVSEGSVEEVNLVNELSQAEAVYASEDENPDYEGAMAALKSNIETFYTAINPIKVSDDVVTTWYYIVSASLRDYAHGKSIVDNSHTHAGARLQFEEKMTDSDYQLWRFVDAGNGQLGIQNKASNKWFGTAQTDFNAVSEDAVAYNVNFLGERGQFTIFRDGQATLHAQENGSLIVNWNGGLDSSSAWRLVAQVSDPVTSVAAVETSEVKVWSNNGHVYVSDKDLSVSVYSLTGVKMDASQKLSTGVYLVKAGQMVYKILVD